MAQSDDEDDYMNMVFEDAPKPAYESGIQRAARKRKEGEAKAYQKPKAELEAQAEATREAALATALPETNKGFKMMAKYGFKRGEALGKSEDARKEPIRVQVKDDRSGIGRESEKKRKIREQWETAEREAKRSKEEEGDYVEMRRQAHKDTHAERALDKAQKTAEELHDRTSEDTDSPKLAEPGKIHLPDINVLWRSRVKRREDKIREKQQSRELTNSLSSRLPTLTDELEDDDDKIALGRDLAPFYTTVESDTIPEDPELAEFEALPVSERLRKLLIHLRETHHYCLYCGYQYPDAEMDGCPGVTEEDHD